MIVGERCLLKGLIPASALWVSTNSPLSQSKSSRPSKWHGTSDLKRVYFVMFLLSLLGWLSLCYRENNHEALYFWKWRNIVLFLLKKVILWWITSVTVQMLCIGSTKDKYVWNCNPILLFSWTPGSSKTAIRHPSKDLWIQSIHYSSIYHQWKKTATRKFTKKYERLYQMLVSSRSPCLSTIQSAHTSLIYSSSNHMNLKKTIAEIKSREAWDRGFLGQRGREMYVTKSINANHEDLIHDVAYDFYGKRMATCSSDQKVKVWDQQENGEWVCSARCAIHFSNKICTCKVPHGKYCSWVKQFLTNDRRAPKAISCFSLPLLQY